MLIYLKEIRKAKRLSVVRLAELSGISKSQISRIERGESDPTFSVMCKLARALQTPYHKIFVCDHLMEEDMASNGEHSDHS